MLSELIEYYGTSSSQVMELKNKCDAVEKRESEKRQLEEKKHQEEIQALKKTNQQLKVSQ